ncbi:MAG: Wzz/FepE/Etk N-terminal domain-containing protein [Desulforhopalus sp.]
MATQQLQKARQLIDIASRRKALIISCILTGIITGLGVYLLQPKTYESTALLSYQQQAINPSKMSVDTDARIKDIVSTLTNIVSSRTSLEKIIVDLGLFKEDRESLPMEDVVEKMRLNISIIPSKLGDTFLISYRGDSPREVANVANSLSARFIEENMKFREERASETSDYTKDELGMAKEMLDAKEAVMRDYKLKYYNEMADQRATNMERLIALQTQYQSKQDSIQNLERTSMLMRDQIAARKEVLENRIDTEDQAESASLAKLEKELKILQEREGYTDLHPRVKNLKKKIAKLKLADPVENEATPVAEKNGESLTEEPFDQALFELQNQLKNATLSIARINKEKDDLQTLINQYEQWVSAAPVREAEWSALTREYGQLKRHYDFLVSRDLEASSTLNLERRQKGSQFKLVDPARMSVKPVKPDFLKIMRIALLLGLGLGGGLAIGLELLDGSFRDPDKLEEALGLEILCAVPHLSFEKEVSRQRLKSGLATFFFLTCATAIVFAVVYLWKVGRIIV